MSKSVYKRNIKVSDEHSADKYLTEKKYIADEVRIKATLEKVLAE